MEGIIFPSHSCPLRFRLFLRLSILHMLFLIKLHIHSQIIQLINR